MRKLLLITSIGLLTLFCREPSRAPNKSATPETELTEKQDPGLDRAMIVASRVRLRAEPTTKAKVIRTVTIGTAYTVKAITDKTETIGNLKGQWLHLEIGEQISGWVFSPFTKIFQTTLQLASALQLVRERLDEPISFEEAVEVFRDAESSLQNSEPGLMPAYKYIRLLAAQAVVKTIPLQNQNDKSGKFGQWLKANRGLLVFSEPHGSHLLKSQLFRELASEKAPNEIREEIAYSAAIAMTSGECEGFVPCYIARWNDTYFFYLRTFPNGKYASEILAVLKDYLQRLDDNYVYPTAKEKKDFADYYQTIREMKKVVSKARDDSTTAITNSLDRLLKR